MKAFLLLFSLTILIDATSFAQKNLWHGIKREMHYKADGEDFVLVNGKRRFNRALYGGNTAFRAEAGDLPEFALYLPGMGGNLKFGLIKKEKSKWLIEGDKIETRYRPGSMIYTVKDAFFGHGELKITAIATYDREALVVKIESKNIPSDVEIVALYGGATGTRFSREGDIGADPESSFNLNPEYCKGNVFQVNKNQFNLFFGAKSLSEEERYEIQYKPLPDPSKLPATVKQLTGIFPATASFKIVDAKKQESPLQLFASVDSATPALYAKLHPASKSQYFFVKNGKEETGLTYQQLPQLFENAEADRKKLAKRIKVTTPDPFINTLGAALAIAADAVWENPSFLHGAVAWRMRLPGWRGAYLADVLGWHDRGKTHFSSYALSQVTEPATGPIEMDTALHLARHAEKMGTSVFSSGYISRNPGGDKRPHHYDMNLVFVDQLLNHFLWTGDTAYVKTMWPLLKRHLAWEDRNFDVDGDHLYDAYAAIWASDALQYSGGGVTHSSAYNYKSYKLASEMAPLVGEDGEKYRQKAAAILKAINAKLWLPDKGVFAEYKDLLGKQLVHPSPALWTIYHAIDSKVPDRFQAYQALRYVDHSIPHIPIRANGLRDTTLYTISTSNWQPYTWSLNNVVLGEVMHTALAYWQGGRADEAFQLWKSSLVESMYLGASPGNFQQLSFYDAIRGELYRDFADDVGMTARSLVEGLFGIEPDLLKNVLTIRPGFPSHWNNASIATPDLNYSFKRNGMVERYQIKLNLRKPVNLTLIVKANFDNVASVSVNGKKTSWSVDSSAIGVPSILIKTSSGNNFIVEVKWKGQRLEKPFLKKGYRKDENIKLAFKKAEVVNLYDPQEVLQSVRKGTSTVEGMIKATEGEKTIFLQLQQGAMTYWLPISFDVMKKKIDQSQQKQTASFNYDKIDLSGYFNDEVSNIFKNQYLSPRPKVPTLQLPTQGIGNWAYPLVQPNISDSGLRKRAGIKNEFTSRIGVPFATPSKFGAKNILFTSQWDNYPDSIIVPLNGKASQAYLLMAGSTNPMQSRMVNGEVTIQYSDGTEDKLELKNPENWWPIEQDFYDDGFAFTTGAPKPLRMYFKTGEDTKAFTNYTSIKGFTNRAIDGGAGTVLDMWLDPSKELKSFILKSIANDVVIGLMSLTLVRPD